MAVPNAANCAPRPRPVCGLTFVMGLTRMWPCSAERGQQVCRGENKAGAAVTAVCDTPPPSAPQSFARRTPGPGPAPARSTAPCEPDRPTAPPAPARTPRGPVLRPRRSRRRTGPRGVRAGAGGAVGRSGSHGAVDRAGAGPGPGVLLAKDCGADGGGVSQTAVTAAPALFSPRHTCCPLSAEHGHIRVSPITNVRPHTGRGRGAQFAAFGTAMRMLRLLALATVVVAACRLDKLLNSAGPPPPPTAYGAAGV